MDVAGDYHVLEEVLGDHKYDRVERNRVDEQREATGLRQSTQVRRAVIDKVSGGSERKKY